MEYMESMMDNRLEASISEYDQMSDRIKQRENQVAQLEQQLEEAKKCKVVLQEICDMQTKNYGYGVDTHLDLIDLCKKPESLLRSPANEQYKRSE